MFRIEHLGSSRERTGSLFQVTDIEQAPIFFFFPETIIISLEWGCLNHMSLHITVWEVSVISPTMGDRVVLRARWGVGEGGWPRAGVGGWRGVRAEAGLRGKARLT